MKIRRGAVVWTLAIVALAAVFMAYTRPDLVVTLADRIWSCF